jgi:hypothetical protein
MPWLLFDSVDPINCALSAITDANVNSHTEKILKFVQRGSGVGITLLNENAYQYCCILNEALGALKNVVRNGRVTVFVPSFHPDIIKFLSNSAKDKRWANVTYGVILFRPGGDSKRLPILGQATSEELVKYYTKEIEIPNTRFIVNGLDTLFRLAKVNTLYILDGDALVNHWNKFPDEVKGNYEQGAICSNLCNEVNLPIDLKNPKFQLCILMGIDYTKYKDYEDKDEFYKWLLKVMKHVWQSIELNYALVEEMGIDVCMHPIGIYFVGTFNGNSLSYTEYIDAYKHLQRGLQTWDEERYFKTYITIPPGSNVLKNWGLSPPLQRPPDSETVVITTSSGNWSIKIPEMGEGYTVAEKFRIYELLAVNNCTYLGTSIEVTDDELDQLYKLAENITGCNPNVLYYNLIKTSKVDCLSCQA